VQIFCTNIIWAAFSSYMYVVKAAKTTFVQKSCTFNIDEIDTWQMSNMHRLKKIFGSMPAQRQDLKMSIVPWLLRRGEHILWAVSKTVVLHGSILVSKFWLRLLLHLKLDSLLTLNNKITCDYTKKLKYWHFLSLNPLECVKMKK